MTTTSNSKSRSSNETRAGTGQANGRTLPKATVAETLRIGAGVFAPTVAKGPIIRRPKIVWLAEKLGFDTGAVKTLQTMRNKYGDGPLMLRVPLRNQAVLLDPTHLRRVLDETHEPFASASSEKRAALAHFEPEGSLVSHGAERDERRRINEETLEHHNAVHHMADTFLPIVDDEASRLMAKVRERGELIYDDFFHTWFCLVRRVVFGNSARDDTRITDLMENLRKRGNWAFMVPKSDKLRDELHSRIGEYIKRGESGSLVAILGPKATKLSAPENQVPQWLFAFDPAAMSTYRGLALLAVHPDQMARAREEDAGGKAAARPHRPFLRAVILESLRLWPTTPMILRQTTRETYWDKGVMPAKTGILIFAPFFHRDDERLSYANKFNPDLWIQDDPEVKAHPPRDWPLVPFSGGPGICPGRNLVLLLTSGMLAALIGNRTVKLKDPQRLPPGNLPGTLDQFTLRFELT